MLSFTAGQTSATFTIPLCNIAAPAGTRSLNLSLYNPANPTQTSVAATAVLNITDNTAPLLAFQGIDTAVNSTDNTATITVNRTGNTAQAASVQYTTTNGTAVAGVDYIATSGTLNFAANQTSATFTVTLLEPLTATAGNQSLTLTLSSPSINAMLGPQYTTTLSIAHAVAPSWIDPSSLASWDPASHTLTVTGSTTLLADPGADEPIIVAGGSAAAINVPATDTATVYHIGGLQLSTGATFTLGSLGAARTSTNYRVLVIGTPNPASQLPFSLDSTSTLDLTDNDLILMHPSGSSPFSEHGDPRRRRHQSLGPARHHQFGRSPTDQRLRPGLQRIRYAQPEHLRRPIARQRRRPGEVHPPRRQHPHRLRRPRRLHHRHPKLRQNRPQLDRRQLRLLRHRRPGRLHHHHPQLRTDPVASM
jgi:hypothetical protein